MYLLMREDGLRPDRLLLTTDTNFIPADFGPDESARFGAGTALPTTPLTRTIVYTYDNLYRLTEADYTSGENYQYSYDPAGNRLQQIINGDTTEYLYDAANRLAQLNGQAVYSFDANGNMLSSDVLTNTWDAANRLVETQRGGATVTPIYNGVGDRVEQTEGMTTTNFALDIAGGLPEVIYTSEGNACLHLSGVIVTESSTGETRYLLSDGLGSVRQAVDENGVVVAYNEFDPYGNPVQNDSRPYGFTGEWWQNEVGLLHLRARWYSPEDGIFLGRDPFEGIPYNPTTINGYNYAHQNPINLTDPSGLAPLASDPATVCMQMPACLRLVLLGGGTAVAVVGLPVAVLVAVPAGAIFICTQFDCAPQPSMPPQPAPAPPREHPSPTGTPVPETRTGTGEDPLTLPPIYQAAEPEPSGTPTLWPIPFPAPRPTPPVTCTPTPDSDKVRLYHGTKSLPSSFIFIDVSRGDGQYGPGFYTTRNRNAAKWFSERWAKGPGPDAIVWADVPKQWIQEARRLTDVEDRALSLRGDWRYVKVPVPPHLEYLMTDHDIIYGPIAGLEPWIQYKFNPIPVAQAKVNSVKWHYEPLE